MKKLLLFLLFLSPVFSEAQTMMTVAEVYNYNIGDVFVTLYETDVYPPNYVRITITNKYYSSGLDTVFYVYDYHSYSPPSTIHNYTGLMMNYTHLNDTLGAGLNSPNYLDSDCIDTTGFTGAWVDSSYYDATFCNLLTTRIDSLSNYYYQDSCVRCFECYYGYTDYGKGVGLKYQYFNNCADATNYPCVFTTTLLWYSKATDSCGTYPITLTTNDSEKNNQIVNIFPNPAHDNFTISFNQLKVENGELKIYDMTGREVMEEKIHSQLSTFNFQLSSGVYFLRVGDGEKVAVQKLVVE